MPVWHFLTHACNSKKFGAKTIFGKEPSTFYLPRVCGNGKLSIKTVLQPFFCKCHAVHEPMIPAPMTIWVRSSMLLKADKVFFEYLGERNETNMYLY